MAATTLTPQVMKGPYVATPVAADSLDVTMTAADVANGNDFVASGRDILVAQNTHATTAYTITITSQADERGRKGDITTYSLAAGDIAVFDFSQINGWADANGKINIAASNASVKFAVLRRA